MRRFLAGLLLIGCSHPTPPPAAPTAAAAPAPAAPAPVTPAPAPTRPAPPPWLAKLPPIIDRDIIFGDPEYSGSSLSPDGKFIAFRKDYKGQMNIWVKKREEPFSAARPLTADTARPVRAFFWTRDGKYVLYAQDKGGDENFRIYAVDPAAANDAATGVPPARDLTPYDKVRAQILAVPKRTPGSILVGLNDRDPQVFDVYQLDVKTGKRTMVRKNSENIAGWVADLDGKLRLGVRQTADGGTEILRVDGAKLTPIYTCAFEESCGPHRYHKDGKRVYLETNRGDHDLTRLVLLDPATGKETFVEEDPEKQVDFGGVEFSEATDELVATYYEGDRLRIYPKEKKFAHDYEVVRKAVPAGDLYFRSATRDDRYHIVAVTSDVDPGAVYLYDRVTGKVDLQYRPYPKLPSENLAPMKPVRYTARDGITIPAYLTVPKGVEAKGLPAVLLPHGGPWARDNWGYDPFAQFLANRGYAVLQPNFRGSTGYGKKFLNLGNKQWGTGTMQHDLTDGAKWLASEGIADAKQIAIMGGSYGGYATLAGLAFTPDLYACGVDIVGPSNIATLLKSIPPYWAPAIKLFHLRVGDPDDPKDAERLKEESPLFSAKAISKPLLVIQGANDPRVKRAEADQIVVALRDLGHEVEYLVAPDEGHGFAGRDNRIAMFAATERFLAAHLPGRAQEGMSPEVAKKLADITVDVKTVKVVPAAVTVGAGAATKAPAFGALTPGTVSYAAHIEAGGKAFDAKLKVAVKAEGPGWTVVETTEGAMGSGTDTHTLDKETLAPVKRVVEQGPTHVEIAFSDGQVKGEIKAGGQTLPIDAKVTGRVYGDGMPLYLALATLPLEAGQSRTLRSFDLLGGRDRSVVATVGKEEDVKVPAGSFKVVRVTVQPEEGAADTIWVEKPAPHRVVRWEAALPAQMGGGKATGELQ